MKSLFGAVSLGVLVALAGCGQGTSGGPGASNSSPQNTLMGQAENTFSLSIPSTKMSQGESKTVSIGIHRGKNFGEDVSLKLGDLPKGVTRDPTSPSIDHGDTGAEFILKTASDAALGDFAVSVTGHPTKGADAVAELRVSIAKQGSKDTSNTTIEAAQEKWDEYTVAMQNQLDQFSAKFEELKNRTSKTEGQARTDLELKLEVAKTKRDAAAIKLDELKSASADRWEKVKEGVESAFNDLKKIFE